MCTDCAREERQPVCMSASRALLGSLRGPRIGLVLKKISKLFVYWDEMALLLLLDCLLPIPQYCLFVLCANTKLA